MNERIAVVTAIYRAGTGNRKECTAKVAEIKDGEVTELDDERHILGPCLGLEKGLFVNLDENGNVLDILCASMVNESILKDMNTFRTHFKSKFNSAKENQDNELRPFYEQLSKIVGMCVDIAKGSSMVKRK